MYCNRLWHLCTSLSKTSVLLPNVVLDLCPFIRRRRLLVLLVYVVDLHAMHFKKFKTFLDLQFIWHFICHSTSLEITKDVHSWMYPSLHNRQLLLLHLNNPGWSWLELSKVVDRNSACVSCRFFGCLRERIGWISLYTVLTLSLVDLFNRLFGASIMLWASWLLNWVVTKGTTTLGVSRLGVGPCNFALKNLSLMSFSA